MHCCSRLLPSFLQSGQLNEYTERKEMSADVVCMSLANVPPGEQRSRFLAVGLVDNTVRIISLDPSVGLKKYLKKYIYILKNYVHPHRDKVSINEKCQRLDVSVNK